jgi:YVTN family beta-propeller protein
MIPRVLIFPAGFLRRCIRAAVLLAALAPLACAAAEEASWGSLFTSAAIVCNPSTHKIYAVNEGAGSVTVIDAATGAMHTVQVGREPIAIAINSTTNRIYIANDGSASVSVIDGTNDTVIATVTSAPLPYTLAVDETTNTIYVTHTYSGSVTVIDGISNTAREVKVGDADSIALDPRTSTVFLSHYEEPLIRFVDGQPAQSPASVGPHVWGMVFDQAAGTLFLTPDCRAEIVAPTRKPCRRTSCGQNPLRLGHQSGHAPAHVVNYGDETLSILDLQTMATIATLPVGSARKGWRRSKSNSISSRTYKGTASR